MSTTNNEIEYSIIQQYNTDTDIIRGTGSGGYRHNAQKKYHAIVSNVYSSYASKIPGLAQDVNKLNSEDKNTLIETTFHRLNSEFSNWEICERLPNNTFKKFNGSLRISKMKTSIWTRIVTSKHNKRKREKETRSRILYKLRNESTGSNLLISNENIKKSKTETVTQPSLTVSNPLDTSPYISSESFSKQKKKKV